MHFCYWHQTTSDQWRQVSGVRGQQANSERQEAQLFSRSCNASVSIGMTAANLVRSVRIECHAAAVRHMAAVLRCRTAMSENKNLRHWKKNGGKYKSCPCCWKIKTLTIQPPIHKQMQRKRQSLKYVTQVGHYHSPSYLQLSQGQSLKQRGVQPTLLLQWVLYQIIHNI